MPRRKPKGRAVNGILLLDKPLGISSNKALQRVKRLFQAQKAGHTGSLDPLATGMLPICFGEATKVSSFLLASNKSYQTTATLGKVTTTGDAEGETLRQRPIPVINKELLLPLLAEFKGNISQLPPMYSALKHKGQPLYKLARQGIEIERKRRQVTIFELTLTDYNKHSLSLQVQCSKGTYIRTLVEDIGEAIGCGAYVSMLHRLTVDPFHDHKMVTLETLEHDANQETGNTIDDYLLPIDAGLSHFPAITLSKQNTAAYLHGQSVAIEAPPPYLPSETTYLRSYDDQARFLGIGVLSAEQKLMPKRLMIQNNDR